MNEDQLNDLKQFIVATVSQATANIATKDDIANTATKDDVTTLGSQLSSQIHDLDLKVDTIAETLNERLDDHESRLTNLEQQAAHA
jgi:hypothetical protein